MYDVIPNQKTKRSMQCVVVSEPLYLYYSSAAILYRHAELNRWLHLFDTMEVQ
jgi:hypothetical protein